MRTRQLTVRLDRDAYDRLRTTADHFGIGPSTLARAMLHGSLRGASAASHAASSAGLGALVALTDREAPLPTDAPATEAAARRVLATLANELATHPSAWPTRAAYLSSDHTQTDLAGVTDEATDTLYVFAATWHALTNARDVTSSAICHWLYTRRTLTVPPERRRTGNWQCRGPRWMRQAAIYRLRLSDILSAVKADFYNPSQNTR